MALNLSTPTAALAFEMALRNQQIQDSAGQFDAEGRRRVADALVAGNDQFEPFAPIYQSYAQPAEAQRMAQARAFNEYLVGLPELLARSAKERAGSGGGSGMELTPGQSLSGYESAADRLRRLTESLMKDHAKSTYKGYNPMQPYTALPRNTSSSVTSKAISPTTTSRGT